MQVPSRNHGVPPDAPIAAGEIASSTLLLRAHRVTPSRSKMTAIWLSAARSTSRLSENASLRRKTQRGRPARGVTLIELLVTLAVAVILMTIAVPSFQDAIVRNRLTTSTNDFVGTINYARAEAIKRGQSVTICKSSTGSACTTTGSQWENGWIVFVDADADGSLDSGETIIRTWPALPSLYTLRPNNNFTNFLRYDGRGAANNIGSFAICHNSTESGAKVIVITRLRPRQGIDSNNDGIPETDSGNITNCENP